jgi:hypothetical protein
MKTAGGGKSKKKALAISATNTFIGVQLAKGKPGINAEQFMAAVIDELNVKKRYRFKKTTLYECEVI